MYAKCSSVVLVASLCLGGTLLSGDKSASDKELAKIHGSWQFIAQAMDGKERPKDQLTKLRITFTGDKWSVTEDGKVVQAGTHKVDPSHKPAHLDAKVTEGEGKGGTMLGIVELQGDTMKVCFDPQGKERPKSLTAGPGQFSAVLQRLKKS